MPGGDRTGPMGMGPMTGGGFGYCSGSAAAGSANRAFGGGRFRGGRPGRGGRGRGWRNRFYAPGQPGWVRRDLTSGSAAMASSDAPTVDPQQDLDQLKQQAQEAAEVLELIRERISQLEGGAGR
ncbi:MAG: DUF5320 family protein [Pirellulaceae bacterium]